MHCSDRIFTVIQMLMLHFMKIAFIFISNSGSGPKAVISSSQLGLPVQDIFLFRNSLLRFPNQALVLKTECVCSLLFFDVACTGLDARWDGARWWASIRLSVSTLRTWKTKSVPVTQFLKVLGLIGEDAIKGSFYSEHISLHHWVMGMRGNGKNRTVNWWKILAWCP